jgi:hypothetical protein
MKMTPATLFATLAAVLTVAAVVAGFVIIPSPSEFRAQRLDDKRVQDFRAIAAAVTRYRHSRHSLPETLDACAADDRGLSRLPETRDRSLDIRAARARTAMLHA